MPTIALAFIVTVTIAFIVFNVLDLINIFKSALSKESRKSHED